MVSEQIKALRRIQHLLLIRDEANKVGSAEKAESLAEEANKIVETLDAEAAGFYRRLLARSRIFLSPLAKGNCSACGMRLPTSLLQHVIACDRYVSCSNCGRLLYVPEVKATGIKSAQPDPRYLLSRFSAPELMKAELKAETKEEAIAELCDVLAKAGVLSNPKFVVKAALEREAIMTTAVGSGLAFPHMRGVEEGVLTFAAGVSKKGIPWGDEVVNLVFFTALPVIASPFYLRLLASLASAFEGGDKLPFILAVKDDKSLWKELNKATRVVIRALT